MLRNPLGFGLFLVVTATLFVRPGEVIPELLGWPVYQVLIITCLAISFVAVLRQLSGVALAARPISVCALGLVLAAALSHLAHLNLTAAATAGWEFFKVVVYYFLLVGLVNTPRRLRQFVACFAVFAVIPPALAVLQYHGAISLSTLSTLSDHLTDPLTGEMIFIARLSSSGIFKDPNDLSLLLVLSTPLYLYLLTERHQGPARWLWLVPVFLALYALNLTQSRGGFLALVVGVLVLLRSRYGWKRMIPLALVILPALLVLFAGRQTSLAAQENTGQQRIQLWSDGLQMLKHNPLFGVGFGKYQDEAGLVAHNSFIHCYAELGLFGGTLFVGMFTFALTMLYRVSSPDVRILDPALRRFQPYLFAAVASYTVGLFSLSNCYTVPTYLVLGLVTASFQVTPVSPALPGFRFDGRFVRRLVVVSMVFLACAYVLIRLLVRF